MQPEDELQEEEALELMNQEEEEEEVQLARLDKQISEFRKLEAEIKKTNLDELLE